LNRAVVKSIPLPLSLAVTTGEFSTSSEENSNTNLRSSGRSQIPPVSETEAAGLFPQSSNTRPLSAPNVFRVSETADPYSTSNATPIRSSPKKSPIHAGMHFSPRGMPAVASAFRQIQAASRPLAVKHTSGGDGKFAAFSYNGFRRQNGGPQFEPLFTRGK